MNTEEYIKKHEELRLKLYPDSLGYPTIGWGHLCVKREIQEVTPQEAQVIYEQDLCAAKLFICHIIPGFGTLSENRQMALLDMSFQLRANLIHFPKALEHIKNGDWALAAADFMDSAWARKQTPSRAIDNMILLIQG